MAEDFSCILGVLKSKGIADDVINELEKNYEGLRRAFPTEDHQRISERMQQNIKSKRLRRATLGVSQANAQARIQTYVAGGKTPKAQLNRLMYVMSRDPSGRAAFADNFENMRALYHARLVSRMADTIQELSPTWFHQVQDRALADDVGRLLMDPKAGGSPQAKHMAAAVRSMFDEVRERLVDKGLKVGDLDSFMPVRHEPALVGKVSKETWVARIKDANDFSRVEEFESGLPFTTNPETRARLDEVLGGIYDSIVRDGMDLFDAFNPSAGRPFSEKFEQSRLFRWKSFDHWKKYQEDFGNGGNLMDTVSMYMNVSARDLAIIHTLGVDPEATVQSLKNAAFNLVGEQRSLRVRKRIDDMWYLVRGSSGVPEDNFLAAAEEVTTSLVRTAVLGLSGLASAQDLVLSGSSRNFYGLATMGGLPDTFNSLGAFYNRTNSERMRKLLHAGLGAETMLAGLIGNHRGQGDFVGARWLHRMNDSFFRINGAMAITEGVRNADAAAAAIGLRSVVEDGLGSAHPNLRAALESYGVTQQLLDRIKDPKYMAEFAEGYGVNIPKIMEDLGDSAAAPFMAVLNDIKYMSSPAPSVALRSFLRGGSEFAPGSLKGALWRSFTMFWQFPMAAFQSQVLRRIHSTQSISSSATQLAAVAAVGTLSGMALVQGRQIASGKEPYEWDDPRLIGYGFLLSGMSGVTGDYIANVLQGRASGGGLMGPIGSLAQTVGQTVAAAADVATGGKANIASPALRTLKSVTPGQNLPLIGVAINRILLDQLRILVDPNARDYFRQQERRLRKENRGHWWRPGQTLPEFAR
jgi:hypothetical protein